MIGNHFESPTAKGWRSEMVLYTVNKAAGAKCGSKCNFRFANRGESGPIVANRGQSRASDSPGPRQTALTAPRLR